MPEEDKTNKTFHVKGFRENEASIVFYTAPFSPEIKYNGDEIKVEFNEAYIYDHANMKTDDFDGKTNDKESIPRIKVKDLDHTHSADQEVKYSLEIKRNKKTGEVLKAKIINSDDKQNGSKTFRNFIVENEFDPENPELLTEDEGDGENSFVYMELAFFDGFELKELYLRENIHVYYRGFEQLGNPDAEKVAKDSGEEPIALLNATGIYDDDFERNTSTGANGMIGVKALVREKDKNGGETPPDENNIEITYDADQVYFFAPKFDDRPLTSGLNDKVEQDAYDTQIAFLEAQIEELFEQIAEL